MKEEERPSYYAILTADVRYDTHLSSTEKLLYAEITALTNKSGMCWASNKYFANLYNLSTNHISKMLSNLRDEGHISIELIYKNNSKEIEKRVITPLIKNDYTPNQKCVYPLIKNDKDNNININNINIIKEYEKEIGTITPFQYEKLISYLDDLSEEMIIEAIHRASTMNKKSLAYIEGILKQWIKSGYKVIADIEDKPKRKHEETNEERLKRLCGD